MKKSLLAFLVCIIVLLTAANVTVVSAQSNQLDSAVESEFNNYIRAIWLTEETVDIDPYEVGLDIYGKPVMMDRFSMPIKPEVRELCNHVREFIDNGGTVSILLGYYGLRELFYISFDRENDRIILSDSGNGM